MTDEPEELEGEVVDPLAPIAAAHAAANLAIELALKEHDIEATALALLVEFDGGDEDPFIYMMSIFPEPEKLDLNSLKRIAAKLADEGEKIVAEIERKERHGN